MKEISNNQVWVRKQGYLVDFWKSFREIKNAKISRKIIRKFHVKNSELKKKKNVSENSSKKTTASTPIVFAK